MKSKINKWYVIGYKDEDCLFGYSQLTPKGEYFKTLKEAKKEKSVSDNFGIGELVILRRTCEVIK